MQPGPQPIRVLLADDHEMLREGLAALIDAEPDMSVVGHAGAASVAVERVRDLRPDVVVLDIMMPGGGFSALTGIQSDCPQTKVLALSVLDDLEHVKAALAGGARGYLVKRAGSRALLSAIRDANRGKTFIGIDEAVREAVKKLGQAAATPCDALTVRECEILRLLARGFTHREIADQLQLSKKTIDLYRGRLHDKLNVRGRAALVRYAIAAGLFGVPSTDD